MKLGYFRKTKKSQKKLITDLKKSLKQKDFEVGSEFKIDNGVVLPIVNKKWTKDLLKLDSNLITFLPSQVVVYKKGKDLYVGMPHMSILKDISGGRNIELISLANESEKLTKEIIHEAAGVEELKPKSVNLYATNTCAYCKMEEAWLKEKEIEHEKVMVDLNPARAQELVQKTGQMGVPVTEIIYEEGDPEYIVGFDKGRLSQILGVAE